VAVGLVGLVKYNVYQSSVVGVRAGVGVLSMLMLGLHPRMARTSASTGRRIFLI
jgi:hypothetical protein